jgi:hypothetical protein
VIDYLGVFANLGDVGKPWTWRRLQRDVRSGLYRCLEREQAAAAAVIYPSDSSRILAFAQAAFGDLRGVLAGLPDRLLDAVPAEGEWTLRKTLDHALLTELSFRANTRYALSRGPSDPVRMPSELRPAEGDADVSGGIADILERFTLERESTDTEFESVDGEQMLRPTAWSEADVDVRFRLHRFGGHLAEHTVQCDKSLAWLGFVLSEARLITRRISTLRGLHERYSDPGLIDEADRLNRELAAEFLEAG